MKKYLLYAAATVCFATPAYSQTCVGTCVSGAGADGVVTAPPSGPTYSYVSTTGGPLGGGQIPLEGGYNGSSYTTAAFSANAGDSLNFWFNYVTSDGSEYADYAWAALLGVGDPIYLFTARTVPAGSIVPGQDLPGVAATLDPASVPILPGSEWSPLGGWSGDCYGAGCGHTGWIESTYQIADAGNYVLAFGVSNWIDDWYDSGLAFSGITVADVPIDNGVPEPGTWAMMLIGFGASGFALRRRRRGANPLPQMA